MDYREQIIYPQLPLAVYREIAAHLRQIAGVQTELIPFRTDHFDYDQSQVAGLELSYPVTLSDADRQRLVSILAFYGDRYGQLQCQPLV